MLTKQTIVETISATLNLKPSQSKETTEELLEIVKETLESGDNVMISGFGRFQVNEKAPRQGRNPATGENLMLKGKRVVTFKCASKLRYRLNNG